MITHPSSSKLDALRILSLWYLDDGIGVGPKEEVRRALDIVAEEAQRVGLRLNLAKCEVWSEDAAAVADFPAEITRCTAEGFELLGVGIGTRELCERILDKRVTKIAESLAMMSVVDDPQTELSLMGCCLGYPRFAFAIRSTPPSLIKVATQRFDQLMTDTAKERLDIGFNERRLKQWILPIRMGGVGLPRAADIAPAAFLANVADTLPMIKQIFQNQTIEMTDIPGLTECWMELNHMLDEDEPALPESIQDILKQAKLDQTIQAPGPGTSIEDFLEMARPPAEKTQHFLQSIVQQKRLRQSLDPNPTQAPQANQQLELRSEGWHSSEVTKK